MSEQSSRQKDTESLIKFWQHGMPTIPVPEMSQWQLWFDIHRDGFGVIVYGLGECARLYNQRRGVMDYDHAIRHSSRVMNCYSRRKRSGDFPMKTLTKDLADALGLPDSMVGMALSKDMFWRCHAQLQARGTTNA
jgi:hypothetical protein